MIMVNSMVYSWCIVGELYTMLKRPVYRGLRGVWCIGGWFLRIMTAEQSAE